MDYSRRDETLRCLHPLPTVSLCVIRAIIKGLELVFNSTIIVFGLLGPLVPLFPTEGGLLGLFIQNC